MAHFISAALASFMASLVEFVEALTVILAVGTVRGWRGAIAGSVAAVLLLAALVATFGSALQRVPLEALQLVVGTLLLLFGLRWVQKAILRSAGLIPLHDEAKVFAKEVEAMRRHSVAQGFDRVAFATSFQITMLEGAEVVVIVIALSAADAQLLWPSLIGALAALLLVAALGLVLHRPLATVPENALKMVVGVLLSGFGTFWTGEGLGLSWPGADWSIVGLIAGYAALTALLIRLNNSKPSSTLEM